MLYRLLYDLFRLLIEILIVRGRGDAQLRAEVLAQRHQLGVLERQVRRPRWQPSDRLLLTAISRALPRRAWQSLLPSPETLLRWHRELARCRWAAYRRRPRRQRPVLRSELHDLIVKLAEQMVASTAPPTALLGVREWMRVERAISRRQASLTSSVNMMRYRPLAVRRVDSRPVRIQ